MAIGLSGLILCQNPYQNHDRSHGQGIVDLTKPNQNHLEICQAGVLPSQKCIENTHIYTSFA